MRFDLPNGSSIQALKDVSLTLNDGELLSVLGPSGCGKTTLLNIIAGFLAPTDGQVVLNGETVTGPAPERGMVFQKGALFEWMNVRHNVDFGPRMKGMAKKERDEITDHLLEIVGLQDFKEKAVYELSGGMQQRVALARALAARGIRAESIVAVALPRGIDMVVAILAIARLGAVIAPIAGMISGKTRPSEPKAARPRISEATRVTA